MTDEDENTENTDPRGALTVPSRAGQMTRRDFGGQSLTVTNPMTEAIAAQERAMVEARYIMAMRRPRDFDEVRHAIMGECKRPGFADVAIYSRPVGREKIEEDGDPRGRKGEWVEVFAEGLSIRFAEVALRRLGNMSCTARTIHDDAVVRIVQITALDYESGGSWEAMITISKTVESKTLRKGQRPLGERVNSYGDRVYIVEANEQRFAAKLGAEISKASRTAILRLVPGEIQDEAFEVCKRVSADRDAKDPSAAKKRLLDGFGEVAVRPSEIVQWLGHPVEQGTRDEFLALSKILSGLREREIVWADVLAERVAARKPAMAPTAPLPAAAAPVAAMPPAGQPTPTGPPPGVPALTSVPPAAPQPAKPATSATGRGSAALKGALKNNTKPAPAVEPEPEAEPAKPYLEIPPDLGPPAEGNEYRACGGCGAVIEAPKSDPPGGLCYACSAGRE